MTAHELHVHIQRLLTISVVHDSVLTADQRQSVALIARRMQRVLKMVEDQRADKSINAVPETPREMALQVYLRGIHETVLGGR